MIKKLILQNKMDQQKHRLSPQEVVQQLNISTNYFTKLKKTKQTKNFYKFYKTKFVRNIIRKVLTTDQFSSPEPLFAGRWGQHLLSRRREAEDGPRCVHREDEVDVGGHHGETR